MSEAQDEIEAADGQSHLTAVLGLMVMRTKLLYLLAVFLGLSLVILDSYLNDRDYLGDIFGNLLALYFGFIGASFFNKVVKPCREKTNGNI